jgi:hypothetical protein
MKEGDTEGSDVSAYLPESKILGYSSGNTIITSIIKITDVPPQQDPKAIFREQLNSQEKQFFEASKLLDKPLSRE